MHVYYACIIAGVIVIVIVIVIFLDMLSTEGMDLVD